MYIWILFAEIIVGSFIMFIFWAIITKLEEIYYTIMHEAYEVSYLLNSTVQIEAIAAYGKYII